MATDYRGLRTLLATPLGFFGLTTVLLEGLVTSTVIFGNLPTEHRVYGFYLILISVLAIILLVWLLVWFKPSNLMLTGNQLLKRDEIQFGTKAKPRSQSAVESEPSTPPGGSE